MSAGMWALLGHPAAVVMLGAWLRWAVRPVAVAFRLGRAVGRMR